VRQFGEGGFRRNELKLSPVGDIKFSLNIELRKKELYKKSKLRYEPFARFTIRRLRYTLVVIDRGLQGSIYVRQ
jgi:hypothetical protein